MNKPAADIVQQLDARDLVVVLDVAETCSFRRAAARLGIGQSAVSRRVRRVEDLLGVSLFERGPAGARLTFAGSEFVACASAVFENLNAAVTRAQTVAVGSEGMLWRGSKRSGTALFPERRRPCPCLRSGFMSGRIHREAAWLSSDAAGGKDRRSRRRSWAPGARR